MRKFAFLIIVCAFVAVIANLPLAWVSPKHVPASYVGTVWQGAVTDIPGFAPVETRVSILNILTGKPPINFSSRMSGLDLEGSATLGGKINLVTNGTMTFVSRVDGRLAGLNGNYRLAFNDMLIRQNCVSGTGVVRTDILAQNTARWQWQGPELSGSVRCDQGDIVMTLSGQDRTQTVTADIRLSFSGTYTVTANVETTDQRAGLFLPLYGFQKSGNGFRLNEQGRWM